jgi:hypothetical protein
VEGYLLGRLAEQSRQRKDRGGSEDEGLRVIQPQFLCEARKWHQDEAIVELVAGEHLDGTLDGGRRDRVALLVYALDHDRGVHHCQLCP